MSVRDSLRKSTQIAPSGSGPLSPGPVPPVSLSVPRRARSGLAADQAGLAPNNSGHPRAERLATPRPRRGTYRSTTPAPMDANRSLAAPPLRSS